MLYGTISILNFDRKKMIDWNQLQLSSYDYQNFILNEDQEQLKLNLENITEWSELYKAVQLRSLGNKELKNKMLIYESSVKKLTNNLWLKNNKKDVYKFYCQFNNELKIWLSQLFDQLDLLHLKNISTTIELVFSRLLQIQENLVLFASQTQHKLVQLQFQLEEFQVKKNTNLCERCQEHVEKSKNNQRKNQIFTIEEPSQEPPQEKKTESLKEYLRYEMHHEENQYDVDRLHYLCDVEEVLKNKQKTLKFNSTPLRNVLSQYLHKMMEILQTKRVCLVQGSMKDYEKMSRSMAILDNMKKLFSHEEFLTHISQLLEEPFAKFSNKINDLIQNKRFANSMFQKNEGCQTDPVREVETIKHLERQNQYLTSEVTALKSSKSKMEIDAIQNLTILHKSQIKTLQLVNRNKQLLSQVSRLESDVSGLQDKISQTLENQREEKNHMIENNITEKGHLLQKIKKLQNEMKWVKADRPAQPAKIISTICEESQVNIAEAPPIQTIQKEELIMTDRQKRKMRNKNKGKVDRRVSIQVELVKMKKTNSVLSKEVTSDEELQQSTVKVHEKKGNLSRFATANNSKTNLNSSSKLKQHTHSKQNINSHLKISVNRELIRSKQNKKRTYNQAPSINLNSIVPLNSKKHVEDLDGNSLKIDSNKQGADTRKKLKKVNTVQRGHKYHRSNFTRQVSFKQSPEATLREFPSTSKQLSKTMIRAVSTGRTQSRVESMRPKTNQYEVSCKILEDDEKTEKIIEKNDSLIKKGQSLHVSEIKNLNQSSKEQLSAFVRFCADHFQLLRQNKAFQLVYNMKKKKQQRNYQHFPSFSLQGLAQDPFHLKKITLAEGQKFSASKRQLELFLSLEEAKKYEKKVGFWGDLDHCIMVDNFQSSLCQKIETFFTTMKEQKPFLYREYSQFLMSPSVFLQQKRGKLLKSSHKRNISQDVDSKKLDPSDIKKIFKMLFRIHNITHKRCNHVVNCLQAIGFTQ